MKVTIQFFLPEMREAIGAKEIEISFSGASVHDVIDHLIAQYGHKARQVLYDEAGKLDPLVQILHNGEAWIPHDELETTLQDGDNLVFMMMMAGG
ncbi:MAG: MoaD family protein [Anaerolineales bacterium]|nr:MoaD family protein [Anaerolineales bacterium]